MSATVRRPSSTGFSRVVVATDFSLDSDRAVRRAGRLPLAARAMITVVHVLPGSVPASALSVVTGASQVELDSARHKLEALLERRHRGDVTVRTRVAQGHAAAEIGRVAESAGADLIVVGRGRSRLSGTLIGTTAQRVARSARIPVLLVRQPPLRSYRRTLLGFEVSADGLRAARLACRITPAPDAKLVAFHAFEDPRADLAPTLVRAVARAKWRAFAPVLAEQAKQVRRALAMADPSRRWSLSFKGGDPRSRLLEAARLKKADLLVVGTRSRRGLPRLALGSVAESVLNQARADVLVSPRRRAIM